MLKQFLPQYQAAIVDMDDVFQAVDGYAAILNKYHLMQWQSKAEQKVQIEILKGKYFRGKVGHDSLVREYLHAEDVVKLKVWLVQVRASIKIGIEKGFINQKSDIYKILQIPPCRRLAGTTIHIWSLWYSLQEEPMNIEFPAWDDDLSNDPTYSVIPESNQVVINEKRLFLKGKPRQVFELLASRRPHYITSDEILTSVWKDSPSTKPESVRATVKKIRQVLQEDSVIEFRRGAGYRLRLQIQ